ncbi:hypothetical protein K3495_g11417 [Podosphaera aphanis]|nr:hypothetical protein K3495_g11417 [Podosphaera aphanis]
MPLLDICGVTGGNKVIQLDLVFLSSEKENNNSLVLQQLRQIMTLEAIRALSSIVTDIELALIKSLEDHFSDTPHLLCRWHVNMNVLAKSKKHFPKPTKKGDSYVRSPDFVESLELWNAVAATSEKIYEQEVARLKAMARKDAYIYVERTWLVWKEKTVLGAAPALGLVARTIPVAPGWRGIAEKGLYLIAHSMTQKKSVASRDATEMTC